MDNNTSYYLQESWQPSLQSMPYHCYANFSCNLSFFIDSFTQTFYAVLHRIFSSPYCPKSTTWCFNI